MSQSLKFTVLRLFFVSMSIVLAVLWLLAVFHFPDSMKDHYGYNQLLSHVCISVAMLLDGIGLFFAARLAAIRMQVAAVVLVAPLIHILGSIESQLSVVLFALPSMTIILVGVYELFSPKSIDEREGLMKDGSTRRLLVIMAKVWVGVVTVSVLVILLGLLLMMWALRDLKLD